MYKYTFVKDKMNLPNRHYFYTFFMGNMHLCKIILQFLKIYI